MPCPVDGKFLLSCRHHLDAGAGSDHGV